MTNSPPKSSKMDTRLYEAELTTLRSSRLVAVSNPKDDLPDQEQEALPKAPRFSPEIIKALIKLVKSL